ncbi:MAG: DUF4234 domain-containing protein [Thermoplasmata archaeon]
MVGERGTIRSPIAVILLSCVTFGIYGIYWMYVTWDEIIRYRGLDKSAVVWGIVLPICTLGIGAIISYIMLVFEIEKAQIAAGVSPPISTVLVIVLLFIPLAGVVSIYMIQDNLNRLWSAAPAGVMPGMGGAGAFVQPPPPM